MRFVVITMKNIFFSLGHFLHCPSQKLLISLFLSLITLAVYFQVRNHEFINFDDNVYVTENRHVQEGLTLNSIKWAFTLAKLDEKAYWHPLTWLSHMADCQIFGLKSNMHHLFNVYYHIVNVILLFLLLNRMTGAMWKSAFVAMIFAVHPINVESVAWISERKNLLSTTFWMLTMLFYTYYAARPSSFRYLLVLIFFSFGLMAKPMLVTLPCVLILIDYWPLYRLKWGQHEGNLGEINQSNFKPPFHEATIYRLILEKIPLLFISLIVMGLAYFSLQNYGAIHDATTVPISLRIANALVSYVKYPWKMVCPLNLAIFYPFPKVIPFWEIITPAFLLIIITTLVILKAKKVPYLLVGWLWYLGTLVPVIGLIQGGLWPEMADRWAYIPFIGLFVIIAWGVSDLLSQWRYRKIWIATLTIAAISLLTVISWRQIGYWDNSITLFEHAIKVTRNNFVAYNNLGVALNRQGDFDKAINNCLQALKINPGYPDEYLNLGVAFAKQGKTDAAINYYLQALMVKPSYTEAHYNLGNMLVTQGKLDEAINHYLQALKINPLYAEAHENLGNALMMQGKIDEAISHFSQALQIKPDFTDAHYNLGIALFRKQDFRGAINCFRDVLKINPENYDAKKNLQYLLAIQQKQ